MKKSIISRFLKARDAVLTEAFRILNGLSSDKEFCTAYAAIAGGYTSHQISQALTQKRLDGASVCTRPDWSGEEPFIAVNILIFSHRRSQWKCIEIPAKALTSAASLKEWRDSIVTRGNKKLAEVYAAVIRQKKSADESFRRLPVAVRKSSGLKNA